MRIRRPTPRTVSGLVLVAAAVAGLAAAGPAPEALAEKPIVLTKPELSLPIRCRPGESCWLVNLVDLDPGPGRRDYLCRAHTYDGHKGTDIAIQDLKSMQRGIDVVAAAPGRVKGLRDGMPDVAYTAEGAPSVEGRECGNGVVLDHGDGWETQYCHLRQGSLRVNRGQAVSRGQRLGLVGNSGMAEFPHVHLSVRYRGRVVDPFLGPEPAAACGLGRHQLWRTRTLALLNRSLTAIYNAGFATAAVKPEDARSGALEPRKLTVTVPALVFWADVFWVEPGDRLTLRLTGPADEVIAERTFELDRTQARRFAFVGKKRKSGPWPQGAYRGEATLERREGAPGPARFHTFRRVVLR